MTAQRGQNKAYGNPTGHAGRKHEAAFGMQARDADDVPWSADLADVDIVAVAA